MRSIPSFSNVLRSENTRMNVTQNALKPGQMLTGKVLELYPNQRAAIQLGGSQVVAQLETSLTSKQDYLFQVTSVGDVLRLKKLSDSPLQNNRQLSSQIMQQLGSHNNQQLKTLIQQLVSQNIPFTHKDGQALAKLLEQFGGNSANRELLFIMKKQNFPLTEQVFRSLQAFQSTPIGTQMNQLHQQLASFNQSNSLLSQLQQQLALFGSPSPSQAQSMLQQFVYTNQPALEQVLSKAIPNQLSSLQQVTNGERLSNNQTQEFTQQLNQTLNKQLPFQQGERQAFQSFLQRFERMVQQGLVSNTFKNIVQQQAFFQKVMQVMPSQEQQMVQMWLQSSSQPNVSQDRQILTLLQQLHAQQLPQSDQNRLRALLLHVDTASPQSLQVKDQFLHLMKHFVQTSGLQDEAQLAQAIRSGSTTYSTSPLWQALMTAMSPQDRQVMEQWINQAQPTMTQNQHIAEVMQRINLQQIPQSEQSLVRQLLLSLEASDQVVNKDQFMQLVRQVIQQTEVSIQTREMDHSLKQNLLLANQQHPDIANNQMQRLIQSLTGMQLHMVQDEQAITQQSFQIPGERFGLAKDIRMQFEGKKRQNSEEIDPEFCRVLFHLHLHTLGETMITMSIQKRIVHISVYNDQQGIKALMDTFTPLLKEKLSDLNYQLSSVTQKALSDKEQYAINSNHTAYKPIKREGIDYRV
ncbi:hypothetical protein [Gracilibacillus thailandensis]|uniref:Flagellar hook-length control protein-like C-terminal domain-containing protein n=1 Tax=Gracilibacillus thailandensis TaxID=563735 RepID=A0A6N7R5J1_9BACI|nr:hypothetical protein [Gracilibacillus thailandensis]MRI68497.1 hypothetical protein [Gracilibacillus thailandensis]